MAKLKYENWDVVSKELISFSSFLKKPFTSLMKITKHVNDFTTEMKEDFASIILARMLFLLNQGKDNEIIRKVLDNKNIEFLKDVQEKFITCEIHKTIGLNNLWVANQPGVIEKRAEELIKCCEYLKLFKNTEIVKSINLEYFAKNYISFPPVEKSLDISLKLKEIFSFSSENEKILEHKNIISITEHILKSSNPSKSISALVKCQEKLFDENIHKFIMLKVFDSETLLNIDLINSVVKKEKEMGTLTDKLLNLQSSFKNGLENKLTLAVNNDKLTVEIDMLGVAALMGMTVNDSMKEVQRFLERARNTDEENRLGVLNMVSFHHRSTYTDENGQWKLNLWFKDVENSDISISEIMNVFKDELIKWFDSCYKDKMTIEEYSIDGKVVIDKYLMERDLLMTKNDKPVAKKKILKF